MTPECPAPSTPTERLAPRRRSGWGKGDTVSTVSLGLVFVVGAFWLSSWLGSTTAEKRAAPSSHLLSTSTTAARVPPAPIEAPAVRSPAPALPTLAAALGPGHPAAAVAQTTAARPASRASASPRWAVPATPRPAALTPVAATAKPEGRDSVIVRDAPF